MTELSTPESPSNWLYVAGLVYFPFVYFVVHSSLRKLLPADLVRSYVVTLSMRLVGSLQSLAACVAGIYVISRCHRDILRDRCWLTNAFAKFSTCYFFVDLFVMYLSFIELKMHESDYDVILSKKDLSSSSSSSAPKTFPLWRDVAFTAPSAHAFFRRNKLITFHHVVLPLIFGPCVVWSRNDIGDFFVGALYLLEASNPFVNLRAVLSLLGYQRTLLYVVNGLLMMIVFFFCRVAIFPFLYQAYATYKGIDLLAAPYVLPVKCNLGCLLLMSMQLYWFGLMIRGLVKIVKKL